MKLKQKEFSFMTSKQGNNKPCVVLVSGGMDSSTLLWWALDNGWIPHAVNIDYNQRHKREMEATKKLCKKLKVSLKVIKFDLSQFGDSPLTNKNIKVPKQSDNKQRSTVVGYRNTFFTTIAAAYAQMIGAHDIFIAPCYEDFQNYRDCRSEFYESLQETLSLGSTEEDYNINVHRPFIKMNKAEIIMIGRSLDPSGFIYKNAYTCYNGKPKACGKCDACVERLAGFKMSQVVDPFVYENQQ